MNDNKKTTNKDLPKQQRLNRPPRKIIIGNLLDFVNKEPLQVITKWTKKYGNLTTFDIFGQDTTVPTTHEDCLKLMQSKNKDKKIIKIFNRLAPTSVFVQQPDKWLFNRTQHPLEVVGKNWIEQQSEIVKNITQKECNNWIQTIRVKETKLNLYQSVLKLTFSIMCETFLGIEFDKKLFKNIIDQMPSLNRQIKFGIPPLSYYYKNGNKKWLSSLKEIINKSSYNPYKTDLLNELHMHDTKIKHNDHLIGEFSALFWGGIISVTSTIVTTIFHITKDPEQYKQLYINIDEMVLPAIKESMRMFPGAPLVIRSVKKGKSLNVGNTLFKENSKLLFCPHIMQNNPVHWAQPTKYDIERFKDHNGYFSNNFFPFGVPVKQNGRGCVGADYALMVMEHVIKSIYDEFKISVINIEKPYKIKSYCGSCIPTDEIKFTISRLFE